jgi:hypothetical protein
MTAIGKARAAAPVPAEYLLAGTVRRGGNRRQSLDFGAIRVLAHELGIQGLDVCPRVRAHHALPSLSARSTAVGTTSSVSATSISNCVLDLDGTLHDFTTADLRAADLTRAQLRGCAGLRPRNCRRSGWLR